MSWVLLFFGFCTVAAILYVLIYAENTRLRRSNQIEQRKYG